ncbi:hypothetical protein G7Y89_g5413 [Cudoniella acicularis]|uniref:Uncharacterized protein n=1 Tax=Cudoniella acicularis TaxID=354080 RepID=A0A8H4W6I3_9HELO|nr:hypothetical protein G7Y89_g5413 [Cudoniella acicularis]
MEMTCSEVQNINITILGNTNTTHTVSATLTGRDGCIFTYKLGMDIPPGNGVVTTVWDQLEQNDGGSPSSCLRFRQFVYARTLFPDSFSTTSQPVDTSTAINGAFGTVACDSYFKNYENVMVTVD